MRADFLGELQRDEPLFAVHRLINVPPLRETEIREVVSRPAELLSAQFETPELVDIITRRTAEESVRDAGALPLLSYTLDDMWTDMVRRGDGILRLPVQGFEMGGVLVDRANNFLATHPGAEAALRRVLTLHCVTVPDDGQPMRRSAAREEWQVVSELADYPYRLFVTVTTVTGETYAELAHEAVIRRWDKLREWIAAEREFLGWRSGLEAAHRAWQATPNASKDDALLMGAALTQAQSWFARRAQDLPSPDREFIALSIERERKARARARRVSALIYVLLVGIIAGLVGWINQGYIKEQLNWYATMRPYMLANFRPYVLTVEAEQALRPLESFRECAKDCPGMIVIPAGEFTMGSPASEQGRYSDEDPQHHVTMARPFAVSKNDVTFDDWDACASVGGCPQVSDGGMGRGQKPVILVNWNDAQQYVAWVTRMTGQPYRLLTEAEWEYAARAGTTTAYYWGDRIGKGNANCSGCDSPWDRVTSPVGSFAANAFGLYDMAGNVWQWVQDCYHDDYNGAPVDGSAWPSGDCSRRVVRGGSWDSTPENLRAANRMGIAAYSRAAYLGFRIGRALAR